MRYFQFREACESIGVRSAAKKLVYWQRQVIPVVKNLENVELIKNKGFEELEFFEITKADDDPHRFFHPVKSRKYKRHKYLNEGFKAFAVINGHEIAGDVWYTDAKSANKPISDLKWLNIRLAQNEAYMFDMFVSPHQRGHHVNNFLVNRAMMALKHKGFKKIYGYYNADNLAALWFHRMHRYTELEKLTVKQFILSKKVSTHI
jgi:GNAT superfamily N-acetyltransferase